MTEDTEKFDSRGNGAMLPAPVEQNTFLATIERLASRPDIDPDKIKQFMDMQEHILDRNAKQAFNAAMGRAQGKIELVAAKTKNEQTKSMYAKLKSILIHAKPIYTGEGFSLMFYEGDTPKENHKRICVDIMHEEGHTEKRWGDFAVQTTGIAGKAMMTQIHGEGSAFSYGRRYLTCAVFNIPTGDDDDGNASGSQEEFITKDQAKKLLGLIEKCGDKAGWVAEKIMALNKVETLDALPSDQYTKAVEWLKKYEAKKQVDK